jgi:hypothetical protein
VEIWQHASSDPDGWADIHRCHMHGTVYGWLAPPTLAEIGLDILELILNTCFSSSSAYLASAAAFAVRYAYYVKFSRSISNVLLVEIVEKSLFAQADGAI